MKSGHIYSGFIVINSLLDFAILSQFWLIHRYLQLKKHFEFIVQGKWLQ